MRATVRKLPHLCVHGASAKGVRTQDPPILGAVGVGTGDEGFGDGSGDVATIARP